MPIIVLPIFILMMALFMVIFFSFVPIPLWVTAKTNGVNIPMISLVFMRLRQVKVKQIVRALILAEKAGLTVSSNQLEVHSMAGGDVMKVVTGLVLAQQYNVQLDFTMASAVDLSGNDLSAAIMQAKSQQKDVKEILFG